MTTKAINDLWHLSGVLLGGGICLNMGIMIGWHTDSVIRLIAIVAAAGMLIAGWVYRRQAQRRDAAQ